MLWRIETQNLNYTITYRTQEIHFTIMKHDLTKRLETLYPSISVLRTVQEFSGHY